MVRKWKCSPRILYPLLDIWWTYSPRDSYIYSRHGLCPRWNYVVVYSDAKVNHDLEYSSPKILTKKSESGHRYGVP